MDSPTISAPEQPDTSEEYSKGSFASSAMYPTQRLLQAQAAAGGSGITMIPVITNGQITGYQELPYDFSQASDAYLTQLQTANSIAAANQYAPELLDLYNKYNTGFVDANRAAQQAADPEAFALRQSLGQQLQGDLALGDQLSASQQYNLEQNARQGQQARGQLFNPNAGIEEAYAKFDVGEKLKQQRQANAQAFAFGQPLGTQSSSAAQQQATPAYTQTATGLGLDTSLGGQFINSANQQYNTAASIYSTQMANRRANPFMTLGMNMLGGAGNALMGGLFGF